jgi:hypothetical protein
MVTAVAMEMLEFTVIRWQTHVCEFLFKTMAEEEWRRLIELLGDGDKFLRRKASVLDVENV